MKFKLNDRHCDKRKKVIKIVSQKACSVSGVRLQGSVLFMGKVTKTFYDHTFDTVSSYALRHFRYSVFDLS